MGEWNQLLITRASIKGVSLNDDGYKYFNNPTKATQFRNDFLLPRAGYRGYDSSTSVNYQDSLGRYWSSSLYSTNARNLYLGSSYVDASEDNYRACGFSLRCFQN
ncbi:MAG: fibrobacter succinogenes major paralogous domain-containing protein [Candidatus Peribacteria bacterium]|jgi:hypothetical protein|nr:fibrobacter succinogenes major paralogous domain-containing protein [Candidatus Peribacteria bacterium]